MKAKTSGFEKFYKPIVLIVIVLQVLAALYFCAQKQGYHYDEYYSYYSSNVTYGLVPTDNEWMDTQTIADEFMVTDGKAFEYGMVRLMQTYDVHPPMYYFVLHTVCSLTPNVFSKWQGLTVNIMFYVASLFMVLLLSELLTRGNKVVSLFSLILYGFSPAIFSGVAFIRMYMMLTFLCMLGLYIHLKAIKKQEYTWKNLYIPVFVTTYIGFMTHYYYVVFLFFVAAFMSLYLFTKKETRSKSFIYAASVIGGMILEFVTYSACLRHIFRGYRGTEAIGAFFDMGNLMERAGLFVGLLDDYVLSGTFYALILFIILIGITYSYISKRKPKETGQEAEARSNIDEASLTRIMYGMVAFVTAGYFLVVLKTALTNAEEAIRYEMPIYGLLVILITSAVVMLTAQIFSFGGVVAIIVLLVATVAQIVALGQDKVLFLYKEDAASYEWARERAEDTVVYIYNHENQWMIWDDAEELMQYDRIFFINIDNEDAITDPEVLNSDRIYVYAVRTDAAKGKLTRLIGDASRVSSSELVREVKYADVYELK